MSRPNPQASTPPAVPAETPPLARWTDLALIDACIGGDDAAWRELIERYGRLVFSIPRRYGFDEAASEDVFQEVFAILVRQLPGIRNGNGLPKWFMTTAHRVCQQVRRKMLADNPLLDTTVDDREQPPDQAEEWERQHLVRTALRRLGGRCQELLTAQYLPPRPPSYLQVAARFDIPVGSIGPTRARCLRKLVEILEDLEAEGGSKA